MQQGTCIHTTYLLVVMIIRSYVCSYLQLQNLYTIELYKINRLKEKHELPRAKLGARPTLNRTPIEEKKKTSLPS
jgi:hypothetical protein